MSRRDTIPTDLVIEILSRLPAKSVARCRCVSKLWCSMLLSPYFTELFLTNSSPRLLFAVQRFHDDWCFLTSPQPQNLAEKPWSLIADFQRKFYGPDRRLEFRGHASGFIHLRGYVDCKIVPVICNPSTGQYASLPLPLQLSKWATKWTSFLGFDPIDKHFKLLSITEPFGKEKEDLAQILTLGTGNDSWRKIHCPLKHSAVYFSQGICINGVLYYLATEMSPSPSLIVCFDVRSEKFKFIYRDNMEYFTKLVNYKGVLGIISFDYGPSSRYPGTNHCLKLRMRVMKDGENLESDWLECFSFCWDDEFVSRCNFFIVGVTAAGEIVLSNHNASEPFYVIYFNQEKNTIQKVEIKIQGLRANYNNRYVVEIFADYVENLNFITMMKATKGNSVTTSTSSKAPHLQQNGHTTSFKSSNKFDSLRLLDDDECT